MKNPKEQPVEVFNFDQIDHLLLLGIAASGLRIGEALALKWTDFKNNVLYVTRRIYDGDVDAVKSKRSERRLPIDHSHGAHGEARREWVFRSRMW